MALDRQAKWSCLPLIAAFAAGLILCGSPTAGGAHTTAKASPTNNCEEPSAYEPTEKTVKERGRKSRKGLGNQRNCGRERPALEPTIDTSPPREARRRDPGPGGDICVYDSGDTSEGKDCP